MGYRQRLTYRGSDSLSNRSFASIRRPDIVNRNLSEVEEEEQNISPVGSAKDTYGYIGFTSQES